MHFTKTLVQNSHFVNRQEEQYSTHDHNQVMYIYIYIYILLNHVKHRLKITHKRKKNETESNVDFFFSFVELLNVSKNEKSKLFYAFLYLAHENSISGLTSPITINKY